jgi:hypothetical protein
MPTIYARIVDGVLVEYPVTQEIIEARSVPPEWYTPVMAPERPEIPVGYALKEIYTITGNTLAVAYSLYEIGLDVLFTMVAPHGKQSINPDILGLILKKGEVVVKQRLNDFAQAKGYDTIDSLVSYATSQVMSRAMEARRGVDARDKLYDAYYAYCAEVHANKVDTPLSIYDISEALPVLKW